MKKIELEGRLYNVTSMDDYTRNIELYNPRFTAIEQNGIVLPIRNRSGDSGPGVYYEPNGIACKVIKPANPQDYSAEKIIDYSNPQNIEEIIKNNELIADIQSEIMTTTDNVFCLRVGDNDTPEMKALKTAINAKQVDKKQYEDRFDQFQNDMRLLKGSSITLMKLITICNAFDISAELTLRDKSVDTPNPMNKEITIDLTEGRGSK